MTKLQKDSCRECSQISELHAQIRNLQDENRKLGNTVSWMHQMIWDLLARNRSLAGQTEAMPVQKGETAHLLSEKSL
ncbi:MAG: hypothetical protein LUE86_01120 [Clostridiales bacterium]|nr:hypothetical protein [Clostridiales bacterium]